ncbi:MAG: ABC transporter ATP-binding protein [Phycisphaerales bacterium]
MPLPISISSLTKRFGATTAVDNVSLTINPGELFFLLGPSGCGKTTILRMLAGFTEPTSGSIHFADRDVTRLPPEKRRVGMVFQSYALWPHMTVLENVEFGLRQRKLPRPERRQRAAEALALVQMDQYAQRKPAQLSGGQQQRVALARALAVQPDVLLLDEPLSNLDAKLRHDMRAEIRRLCRATSITTVYVTHDQKEALSLADRLAVMRQGRIEQLAPPREMYQAPTSTFVAEFLGAANLIPATIHSHTTTHTLLDSPLGQLHVNTSPTHSNLQPGARVTALIRPEAITPFLNSRAATASSTSATSHSDSPRHPSATNASSSARAAEPAASADPRPDSPTTQAATHSGTPPTQHAPPTQSATHSNGAWNMFHAVVEESEFLGESISLIVRSAADTAASRPIHAMLLAGATPPPARTDRVTLHVDPSQIAIIH